MENETQKIILLTIALKFKIFTKALAGVAQWIERKPANQRVAGLIPNLGHMPGLQARSPVGGLREATTH